MSSEEITPDEVLQYLQEENKPVKRKKSTKRKTTKKSTPKEDSVVTEDNGRTALEENGVHIEGNESTGTMSVSMTADRAFAPETTEIRDEQLGVLVRQKAVPITTDDKINYMLAVLDNKPVIFSVTVLGKFVAKLRSLTPYEEDLIIEAVHSLNLATVPSMMLPNYIQQMRLSMQLLEFNGRRADYLTYKYESGKRAEHAKDLLEKAQARFMTVEGPLYRLYITAGDVFENKLARMHAAALDDAFWDPASTD